MAYRISSIGVAGAVGHRVRSQASSSSACARNRAISDRLVARPSWVINARAAAASFSLSMTMISAFISNGLRIDLVVLGMCAEEPDLDSASAIVDLGDQSEVVSLDIEHGPPGFEDAGFRVAYLHVRWLPPEGAL